TLRSSGRCPNGKDRPGACLFPLRVPATTERAAPAAERRGLSLPFEPWLERTAGTDPSGVCPSGLSRGLRGGRDRRRLLEHQLAAARVDEDGVALVELVLEQPQGERVLDQPLERALQRPGAVGRVPTRVGDGLLRRVRELQREPPLGQAPPQPGELQL